MSYYRTHLFFCTNQRDNGRKCCAQADACAIRDYIKDNLKQRGLAGPGGIRVNAAGCLGRCKDGPSLVVYPQGTWYTYQSTQDIDEIVENHLIGGQVVERLLMENKDN